MTTVTAPMTLTKRQQRRSNDLRKGARRKLLKFAAKKGGVPVPGLSNLSDEVLNALPDLPMPDVDETMFDSGSARNLIAKSLIDEFPEFLESVGQVVQLETAGGKNACETAIRYLNADAGFEVTISLLLFHCWFAWF